MNNDKIMGALTRIIYYTIKDIANSINNVDMLVLSTALRENWAFEKLPFNQQFIFKKVSVAVLEVLKRISEGETNK